MPRTMIANIKKAIGQEVTIKGWAHLIRDLGNIKFVIVRDITGSVQTVILKSAPEVFKTVSRLTPESVISLTGKVKEAKQAPGGVEIEATAIKVLSKAAPELPIAIAEKATTETGQGKRLDWRWIDLREPSKQLILKVWTAMEEGIREFFIKEGFIQIYSPKLMGSPSESGSEVFEVPYFKTKAYLAQSPQFYKQMAMAAGLEKVFEVGPVFRAEPSFTIRHATEFTGYDAEFSFIKSHQDVMQLEEKMLVSTMQYIKDKYGAAIQEAFGAEVVVPTTPFPKVTMEEAKAILKKLGVKSEKVGDLSPEEERTLAEHIFKEKKHQLVFVTEYPKTVRPFYHMRFKDNPKLTKSFDLIFKGLEVTTGAQREHRYSVLKKQAKEKEMNLKLLEGYLNFFKYGCPPHGGFGFGPGRFVMQLLELDNIREATLLHRGVNRLYP